MERVEDEVISVVGPPMTGDDFSATADRNLVHISANQHVLSRAERKRTSGAEQNRTTERHVVKHQGPGGVRARFRQLPEVGWTSCCA